MPEFVAAFRSSSGIKRQLAATALGVEDENRVVFEENGYLTFIDTTKAEAPLKADSKPSKPEPKEVQPAEPADLKFKSYFDEFVPYDANKGLKHKYTVSITRAIFDDDCFEVWKKYEFSIHNKKEKAKSSYESFLCQSPLYDPSNSADAGLPYFEDDLD